MTPAAKSPLPSAALRGIRTRPNRASRRAARAKHDRSRPEAASRARGRRGVSCDGRSVASCGHDRLLPTQHPQAPTVPSLSSPDLHYRRHHLRGHQASARGVVPDRILAWLGPESCDAGIGQALSSRHGSALPAENVAEGIGGFADRGIGQVRVLECGLRRAVSEQSARRHDGLPLHDGDAGVGPPPAPRPAAGPRPRRSPAPQAAPGPGAGTAPRRPASASACGRPRSRATGPPSRGTGFESRAPTRSASPSPPAAATAARARRRSARTPSTPSRSRRPRTPDGIRR